jgi:hypothetical protein
MHQPARGTAPVLALPYDSADAAIPYGRLLAASASSAYTDRKAVSAGAGRNAFHEVLVRGTRIARDTVPSFMYRQKSSGPPPSAVRVTDFPLPS